MIIDFSTPRCILLCGKMKKGKSNMCKYLLLDGALNQRIFNFGLVFTQTKYSGDYDFLPDQYIIKGYDENILRNYVKQLEKIKESGITPPANFIVFDDLLGILKQNNSFLLNFITISRHLSCNIFLLTQYLNVGSSTTLRECCSHAIMFNSKNYNTLDSLYKNFGQLFSKFDDFKYNFLDITSKPYHACLYIQDEDDVMKNYLICKAPDMSDVDTKIEY